MTKKNTSVLTFKLWKHHETSENILGHFEHANQLVKTNLVLLIQKRFKNPVFDC